MKFYAVTALLILTGTALSSQPALSQSARGGASVAPASTSGMTPRSPAPPPGASVYYGNVYGDAVGAKTATNGKVANGPKQETSKAPLPTGYAYDANGRIGLVGNAGATGGARSGGAATTPPPQMNRTGYPNLPSSVDPAK